MAIGRLILEDHARRSQADRGGTKIDKPAETINHDRYNAGCGHQKRHADDDAGDQQSIIAACRAAHRDDVVQTHCHVGDDDELNCHPQAVRRRPDTVTGLAVYLG